MEFIIKKEQGTDFSTAAGFLSNDNIPQFNTNVDIFIKYSMQESQNNI